MGWKDRRDRWIWEEVVLDIVVFLFIGVVIYVTMQIM